MSSESSTSSPALDALTEEHIAGRSDAAGEVSWLRDRRLAAYKRFVDQEWPDSFQDEYWRQTPFDELVDVELPISAQLSIHASAPDPVEVVDLVRAAGSEEHGDLVREHLGSLTTTDDEGTGAGEDRTITANDAAWTGGVLVHIPADAVVDEPVRIDLTVDAPGAHLPRVLIVAGPHSRVRVHLEHDSELAAGGAALVDEVVEVVVGDGAHLDVVSLHEWGGEVTHLSLQKAAVHRAATYRHLSVTVGGATVRFRPEVDLVGQGASCEPLGVYFADDGQHFDLQPYIRHIAPRATSDVLFKGALQGRSRTVFRGNVLVEKDAVGTDTDENNQTLILTEGAKADSTPFLEIHCSDITAGHGSATGQIDARHLFYLQSRGIAREQALRLIVFGFFREVLDRMGIEEVEERAMVHIEREIETADLDAVSARVPTGSGAPGDTA